MKPLVSGTFASTDAPAPRRKITRCGGCCWPTAGATLGELIPNRRRRTRQWGYHRDGRRFILGGLVRSPSLHPPDDGSGSGIAWEATGTTPPRWWAGTDSNRRSPRCKRDVITARPPAPLAQEARTSSRCRACRGCEMLAMSHGHGESVSDLCHHGSWKPGLTDPQQFAVAYEPNGVTDPELR
jgi:hypothetical protein